MANAAFDVARDPMAKVGSANSGMSIIDFGSNAYTDYTTITVAQPVPPAAHVRAWIAGHTMQNNDPEAHKILGLFSKIVTNVVDGGFTIDVFCYIGRARGRYRIDWSY